MGEERTGPGGMPLWRPGKPWIGRPTVLTQVVGDKVIEAVAAGLSLVEAALYAGIGKTTLYDWLKRAEDDDPTLDQGYVAFAEAVKQAEGQAAFFAMKCVQMGTEKWQSSAWQLERRYPERYGLKKDQVGATVFQYFGKGKEGSDDSIPPDAIADDPA